MENKVYTQDELKLLKIITTDYQFNLTEEGIFSARLDLKAKTHKGYLRAFFTLDDGRKFIATAHWWQKYLHLYDIADGTKVLLTYTAKANGNIFLSGLEVFSGVA